MKNKIKELRKEKGLTQLQLAIALNLDQTTISKWEVGKALPDTSMLTQLASFFDVSTDYLLGLSPLYYPDRIHQAPSLTLKEKEMLDIFNSLASEYQVQILEYARYLAERTQSNRKKI